jgi:hydrogenase maturation protease
MNILVLGIGQSLCGDDAAGLEAVHLWQARHPDTSARVQVGYSELPGLALLDLFVGVEAAILVDAVHSTKSAGSVILLGPDELASYTPQAGSSHGWGVAETLQLGLALNPALAQVRLTLIGIVGKDFRLGAGLSPQVRKAIGKAADLLENEIQNLLI